MYINSLSCHIPLAFQCGYRWHNKRRENRVWEDGSKIFKGEERITLTGLLYADDLVLCGESEDNLRVVIERTVEVC